MSLTNIKLNNQSERGFTIVELLIVVVVIAILAAITIVSYNGITNRANQSAAKSVAANVQKKVELYNSEEGRYPIALSEFTDSDLTGESFYINPDTFTDTNGSVDPNSGNGTKKVRIQACQEAAGTLSASTITGIRIGYWNYGEGGVTPAVSWIELGQNCSVTAGLANLGS